MSATTLFFLQPQLSRTSCPCNPDSLNGLDRGAVDNAFQAGATAANITMGLGLAIPYASLAFLDKKNRRLWADDNLILSESIAVTALITEVVKISVSRPYPFLYSNQHHVPEQERDRTNYASFWSGHTALPMAAAVTFDYLFEKRHPHSKWRWFFRIAGPSLALAAGSFHTSAGNHFPTDVLAGAAAGGSIGFIIPWMHDRW